LSASDNNAFKLEEALKLGKEEFVPQSLKNEATQIALRSKLNKEAGKSSITGIAPAVKATGIIGTEILGKAVGSKVVQTPKDFTKKILGTPDTVLSKMGEVIDPVFGTVLQKAVTDTSKKDRLLWSLSQQPAFREAVQKYFDNEENTTQLQNIDN
jgi:hypothetical protein